MIINKHHLKSPVEIIDIKLGIPQKYKQKCIDEIYKIGDSQNQSTNVKAIMSSWFLWEESKIFNPLLTKITDIILVNSKDKEHLALYEAWSAIYKKNHYSSEQKKIFISSEENKRKKYLTHNFGDASFLHMNIKHRSGTNLSKKFRITLGCRFHDMDSTFNTGYETYNFNEKIKTNF